VRARIAPGGLLTLDIADGSWMRANFAPRSWEWIGARQLVCRERSLASDGQRLVSREIVVDLGTGVVADQFYAERLYSRTDIAAVLDRAGFADVRLHEPPATISDRGQYLGLLQHRMLVTAVAPITKAARAAIRMAPEVVVVLGDPRLPDAGKLGGRFGPSDLEEVTRLREALGRLPYRVTLLDDHATLADRLRERPQALAFNLCDTGLHNRAERGALVPALLETLSVSYTGSGPACLTLCFDKAATSMLAAQLNIPVPREVYLGPGAALPRLAGVLPNIFKPNAADGSFGITAEGFVTSEAEATAALARLRAADPHSAWLLQEFLVGDEYSMTLVGNPHCGLRALPAIEVDYRLLPAGKPRVRSYASKAEIGTPAADSVTVRPAASLTQGEAARMAHQCESLFARLGCRD
jgi:D-alanine-D-alanine ligase